ncbi:hypothetical protein EMCRGX_G017789 [Ephydatia muelleri]
MSEGTGARQLVASSPIVIERRRAAVKLGPKAQTEATQRAAHISLPQPVPRLTHRVIIPPRRLRTHQQLCSRKLVAGIGFWMRPSAPTCRHIRI